jgi:hypothetical protein
MKKFILKSNNHEPTKRRAFLGPISIACLALFLAAAGIPGHLVRGSEGRSDSSDSTVSTPTVDSTVRVNDATMQRGQNGTVTIDLLALGSEGAVGFSVAFDPAQLAFVSAVRGSGAGGTSFIVNSQRSSLGEIGILVATSPGTTFPAGTQELVVMTFTALSSGTANPIAVNLGDSPVTRQIIDANAQPLPASWLNGSVTIGSGCVYTISPPVRNFSAKGGAGTANVITGANCSWFVTNATPWLLVTGGSSGMGPGTLTFQVNPNAGIVRTGSVFIADQTLSVRQGANFFDVSQDSVFYEFIGKLSAAGITIGCNPDGTLYCPTQAVTREQMGAFIIRALGEFNPPSPPLQRFSDVPSSNVFYPFINEMALRAITVGCDPQGTMYCPGQVVTREQMAAFIIRALGEFNPPFPAQQRFGDVFSGSVFYGFIDQMAIRGITVGCNPAGTLYCPGDGVTREQMAAFIVRAFGL